MCLGILLYSCVLRTKTRSKIAPWQVQRSFDRRICAKAMKSPQTIRRYWQGLWRCIGANPSGKTYMYPFHVCLTSFLRSKVVVFPSFFCCLPVLILSPALPERVARRENRLCLLSLRQNKKSVFSRTCAGKRHLKSRERGDERGVHGEKTG